jgi:DNA repair protein REV1
MDCFFVSVGLRNRPELRGHPVVVTHSKVIDYPFEDDLFQSANPNGHSEIASCSYEAREYGVSNGMWLKQAMIKCPTLQCLPYAFEEYRETAKLLYTIISRYSLEIKAVSCDELYVDLTDLCAEMGIADPLDVIKVIREEIFQETGCPASAGLGKL